MIVLDQTEEVFTQNPADSPAPAKADAATVKPSANIEKITFEKETLPNGLDVIYAPLKTAPSKSAPLSRARLGPYRAQ